MNTDATATSSGERLHALDAVRALALLLGVVFHAAMSFVPGISHQVVADNSLSAPLGYTVYIVHIFRMATFFVLAGFFARLLFERHGLRAFAENRLSRIGIPLIIAWPIMLVTILPAFLMALEKTGGYDYRAMFPEQGIPLWMHLWFLWLLLWLYPITLGLRYALLPTAPVLRQWIDACLGWLFRTPLQSFILAIPIVLILATLSPWRWWWGIPTPGGLLPYTQSLAIYGYVFILGWCVHRQPGVLQDIRRYWPLNLTVGCVAALLSLHLCGWQSAIMAFPDNYSDHLMYAGSYGVAAMSLSLAMIGMGLAFLSNESPVVRYISDASYWIYIMHIPIVIWMQTLLLDQPWHWGIKFPLILLVTMVVLVLVYDLWVRTGSIGEALNGRRAPSILRPRTLPSATQ